MSSIFRSFISPFANLWSRFKKREFQVIGKLFLAHHTGIKSKCNFLLVKKNVKLNKKIPFHLTLTLKQFLFKLRETV